MTKENDRTCLTCGHRESNHAGDGICKWREAPGSRPCGCGVMLDRARFYDIATDFKKALSDDIAADREMDMGGALARALEAAYQLGFQRGKGT